MQCFAPRGKQRTQFTDICFFGSQMQEKQGQYNHQQHNAREQEDFGGRHLLHRTQFLVGLPTIFDYFCPDIWSCHRWQQHLKQNPNPLKLSRLLGRCIVANQTVQAGGQHHARAHHHDTRHNHRCHRTAQEHEHHTIKHHSNSRHRNGQFPLFVDNFTHQNANGATNHQHQSHNKGVVCNPQILLDIDNQIGHIDLLTGAEDSQGQQGEVQVWIGKYDIGAQTVEDGGGLFVLGRLQPLRFPNQQLSQCATRQCQTAHNEEKLSPLPCRRQTIQGTKHQQHGHHWHNRKDGFYAPSILLRGDIRNPRIKCRIIRTRPEESHHAVQRNHENSGCLHRGGGWHQLFQPCHGHECKCHDAQTPQQIATDHQTFSFAQFVRQRTDHQCRHRRHNTTGGDHRCNHIGISCDGVIEKDIEVHILHNPSNLSNQTKDQQCEPSTQS